MREINGFTIIATHRRDSSRGDRPWYIILGARSRGINSGPNFEYVVAMMDSPEDTGWNSGSYYYDLISATRTFQSRKGE